MANTNNSRNSSFEIKPFFILAAWLLFMCFCLDTTQETLKNCTYLFMLISFLIIAVIFRDRFTVNDIVLILFLGVFLRSSYVLYTAIWTRQHDVIDFGTGEGHAGYIEYIFNNMSLPTGDPRERWAFFQPPLHHIIAAVWMKICSKFSLSFRQLQENVQILTLFYTNATMFFAYFTCRELKLKKWGMRAAMLVIAFHPVFVIMSGSINNDALSLMFCMIAVYIALKWYREPKMVYIILLALSIGLSMFAKLSGGLAAPAVAVLFLVKLVKTILDRSGKSNKLIDMLSCDVQPVSMIFLIAQYAVFAIIVFPIGIWWEIRNVIKFGMPFNYIPPVGEQLSAGLLSRIFDIRMHSVYPAMIQNNDAYDEYNVFLAMLKTSLFDDCNLGREAAFLKPSSVLLFISALLLVIICIFATVKAVTNELNYSRAFLAVLYLSLLAGYLSFAFGSNNYSAENFRYISMAVIVEAIFLGLFVDSGEEAETSASDIVPKGRLNRFIVITAYLFAVSSFVTYILLGFAR